MSAPGSTASDQSSLATWEALCKDCRNNAIRGETGKARKKRKDDLRQEEYEYSDVYARRQFERGQSRSDRCPECRKRHKKEIAAFPVAYVDITAIGEAAKYVTDADVGPTGPLGGLGPLPDTHNRRTEFVNLDAFALGLTSEHILELLDKMRTNQVVILEAGTGTGKSTLAPFRLMNPPPNATYRPTDIGPIIVTEPRVPATTEVAQFVGEAMCFGHDPDTCFSHVGPGYPVGYQCEGQKNWDEACSLIYVTDGTMVNWITNGDLARIGTVIVDEAHERSENIDLILTLLAAKLPSYPHLRVVIASATIDKNYFMKFFQQTPSIRVAHQYVKAKKSIGYGVPLFADIDFTEDVLKHGFAARDPANPDAEPRFALPGWPDEPNPEEDDRTLRAMTRDVFLSVRKPAQQWPKGVEAAAVEQTMEILEATDRGDILVFLPNQRMVQGAQEKIQAAVEEGSDVGTVRVYWLMRATPKDEKKQALAPCLPGERKVVVASNLAETSLTIAGIKYVVDSGLVSQTVWDPDLAVPAYPLMPHSQSGVRQRWGRVGRKTHGWVFPLYSLANYMQMPRDTPAGSTQTNLEGTVLKLIAAGEDPSTVVFPADFEADGIVRDSFAQASADSFRRERLRAFAAAQTNGAVGIDGKTLTRLGAELTRSRVSSEKAIALMFADRLACVPEVATVLATLAGREDNERDKGHLAGPGRILASDPAWPIEWNVHARRCHEALAIGCIDDLDLVIRIFADWKAAENPTQWCARWWVDEDVLEANEASAAKLMDSLAPGMSKEAKRPLDPRLAVRARAVLSRALGSLRYHRSPDDGLWRSANPAQPDPVGVSPLRLIAPPDDVVALIRERADRSGPVVGRGALLGLVRSLAWATDGNPTDFELLRRVSLRREESFQVDDPTRDTRTKFPVGALVQVTEDASGAPSIEKLTDGLSRPDIGPRDESIQRDKKPRSSSRLAYTSETAATGDELNLRPKAGTEAAEEEVRLTPIPITALENSEIEDFTGLASYAPGDVARGPAAAAPVTVVTVGRKDAGTKLGVVVAYRPGAGSVELLIEPAPTARPVAREIGDELSVMATGVILTDVGPANEFQVCDEAGQPIPGEMIYNAGVTLDPVVVGDVAAVSIGSLWTGRIIPGALPGHTTISLADGLYQRVIADPALTTGVKAPTIATVVGTLTGEEYRDWKQNPYVIAGTNAFGSDFMPRFAIRVSHLEKAGIAAQAGARVKLHLRLDTYARRSGEWKPDDVERLVDERTDIFEIGHQPKFVALVSGEPLQDDGLDHLLAVDPSNYQYEKNAWQLWETSRRVGVRQISALGEADVAPDVADTLRRAVDQSGLRKQFSVGVTIGATGKVSIVGNNADVAAALDHLRGAALETNRRVDLPRRPDGMKPVFPTWQDVAAALAGFGELTQELVAAYDEKRGRLPLDSPEVIAAASRIADELGRVVRYDCVRLTFAEPRGFYAFKSKPRWERIAATVDGLNRWLIEDGIVWGLFASDPDAIARGVAEIRAELPAVSFSVAVAESMRPSVTQIPPITDTFHLGYRSPTPTAPHSADSYSADAASDLDAGKPDDDGAYASEPDDDGNGLEWFMQARWRNTARETARGVPGHTAVQGQHGVRERHEDTAPTWRPPPQSRAPAPPPAPRLRLPWVRRPQAGGAAPPVSDQQDPADHTEVRARRNLLPWLRRSND